MSSPIYDLEVTTATGEPLALSQYRGKVLLIVNTASRCGFAPQFEGLQQLYRQYREQGLEVLAFPCNQFAHQEPGSSEQIQSFCQLNYQVEFPVFAKVEVNGKGAHPLYRLLKRAARGFLGSQAVKWNFTKFLVDREGRVVGRFAPATPPEKLGKTIEKLLG